MAAVTPDFGGKVVMIGASAVFIGCPPVYSTDVGALLLEDVQVNFNCINSHRSSSLQEAKQFHSLEEFHLSPGNDLRSNMVSHVDDLHVKEAKLGFKFLIE